MIVDQHEEVCHRLGRALDASPGMDVVLHTPNIMQAAELAHHDQPDVILADFKWGPADRPDTLRWLAQISPSSVIIVYSSYYLADERERFEEAGAARCLLKGLTLKELEVEVHQTLDAVRAARLGTSPIADPSAYSTSTIEARVE